MSAPASSESPVIWVVDDDEDVGAHLRMILRRAGSTAEVRCYPDAEALRSALASNAEVPDLVLLDEVLPEGRGSALVADVDRVHPGAPIRLITAAPDEVAEHDRHIGVIAKPPSADEILALLSAVHPRQP